VDLLQKAQGGIMLEVKNLCAGYGGGDVIRNLSFKAGRGESLCVLGPNGCGKSTLLKSIARIIDCRGTVALEGRSIASFSRRELAKNIALLGQSAQVFFPYTVHETVSMGRYAHSTGILKNLSAGDRAIVEDAMKKLDIWDIKQRMIDELSGGQLQRVFLARTLAQNPEVILLDEPTNHLDLKYQIELLYLLKTWARENSKTLIGVFHDLNLARHFGDTAVLMNSGEIAVRGTIEETLKSETMQAVYGIDIRAFMLESLEKWRG
jgi:iron complex transport system ATP-binding protein